jgi:predicted lysophospholipase L1 biosynthesis ABC-type transport system permease subunit
LKTEIMVKLSALSIPKEAVLTAGLVGAATIAPLFGQQLVTGTIVNAALFLAVLSAGFRAAAVVAIIPSLIALAAGTLPAAMAAMVPYIMASNIALAGIFSRLRKTNYWLAAAVAVSAKFGILVLSAAAVLTAITHGSVALALASMMGWPQLITAILGGILAYGINLKLKNQNGK